ncbi:hypothetical protein BD779DRAFT_1569424, partial [Infundibulicybe gibba]
MLLRCFEPVTHRGRRYLTTESPLRSRAIPHLPDEQKWIHKFPGVLPDHNSAN